METIASELSSVTGINVSLPFSGDLRTLQRVYARLLLLYDESWIIDESCEPSMSVWRQIHKYMNVMGVGYLCTCTADVYNVGRVGRVWSAMLSIAQRKHSTSTLHLQMRKLLKQREIWLHKKRAELKRKENKLQNQSSVSDVQHAQSKIPTVVNRASPLSAPLKSALPSLSSHQLTNGRVPLKSTTNIPVVRTNSGSVVVPPLQRSATTLSGKNISGSASRASKIPVPQVRNIIPSGHQLPRTPAPLAADSEIKRARRSSLQAEMVLAVSPAPVKGSAGIISGSSVGDVDSGPVSEDTIPSGRQLSRTPSKISLSFSQSHSVHTALSPLDVKSCGGGVSHKLAVSSVEFVDSVKHLVIDPKQPDIPGSLSKHCQMVDDTDTLAPDSVGETELSSGHIAARNSNDCQRYISGKSITNNIAISDTDTTVPLALGCEDVNQLPTQLPASKQRQTSRKRRPRREKDTGVCVEAQSGECQLPNGDQKASRSRSKITTKTCGPDKPDVECRDTEKKNGSERLRSSEDPNEAESLCSQQCADSAVVGCTRESAVHKHQERDKGKTATDSTRKPKKAQKKTAKSGNVPSQSEVVSNMRPVSLQPELVDVTTRNSEPDLNTSEALNSVAPLRRTRNRRGTKTTAETATKVVCAKEDADVDPVQVNHNESPTHGDNLLEEPIGRCLRRRRQNVDYKETATPPQPTRKASKKQNTSRVKVSATSNCSKQCPNLDNKSTFLNASSADAKCERSFERRKSSLSNHSISILPGKENMSTTSRESKVRGAKKTMLNSSSRDVVTEHRARTRQTPPEVRAKISVLLTDVAASTTGHDDIIQMPSVSRRTRRLRVDRDSWG